MTNARAPSVQELRYAIRGLARSPSFTVVATLTLALGIASATAMFSVVDTIVLRGLPYRAADRLETVYERSDAGEDRTPSYPTFQDWQAQSAVVANAIDGMAFIRGDGVSLGNDTERKAAAYVTSGFFALMGTQPLLGRTFLPDEERAGAAPVAVASYEYFVSQFGGDPSIVGKTIAVDSVPTTVIGVMPRSFAYPNFAGPNGWFGPSVWEPIAVFEASHAALKLRGLHVDSRVVLRLRSGVDSARAAAVMHTIAQRLASEYPVEQAHWTSVALQPIADELLGDLPRALLIIAAAIGLVLVLACANVMNLFLVRASARGRDLAVRSALGASAWRLARMLFVEAALVSLTAGALGLWLAFLLIGYVRSAMAWRLPFASHLSIDARAFVFAAGVSMASAVIVALLPALQARRLHLAGGLRVTAMGSTSRRDRWIRSALVSFQFALAVVLLVNAGLLLQSVRRIVQVPLGFDDSDTIDFAIAPPKHRYASPAEAAALYQRILDAVTAVPGVESAGAAGGALLPVKIETAGESPERSLESVVYHPVSTDYRQTLRIPMRQGRWFTDDDMRSPVGFVVNEKLARLLWPSQSALGRRVTARRASQARADFGHPMTFPVIGVLADVSEYGPTEDPPPELYLPYTLEVWPWMHFVVRASNPAHALPAVERALRSVEPSLNFFGKPSVAATGIGAIDAQRRFTTFVLAGFAGCALLLATLGLYGTIAYSVTLRRHEIGVRIALGASRQAVILLVARHALALVVIGTILGGVGAVAALRLVRSLLFQTTLADVSTLVAVPAVLAAAAALASYRSAASAARTDPMIAMRGD